MEVAGAGPSVERPEPGGDLEAARALRADMPEARAVKHGDAEGYEWWEAHGLLLERARVEYGANCPDIYQIAPSLSFAGKCRPSAIQILAESSRWILPSVLTALADGSPAALRSLLVEVCRDSAGFAVYQFDLFTDEFCDLLLLELDHIEGSGIPLRRPNGMNRYGAILSQLGFQEGLLEPLMRHVVLPLGHLLWPEWVSLRDCDETYGFVVRYRLGEDVELAEHADTSNITLNACLGREFEEGGLYFKGVRFTPSNDEKTRYDVPHKRGAALLHLGGHFHGAYPITSGERHNLVLWATGDGGVVRIRPETL